MSNNYIFILGRNTELSLAELRSLFAKNQLKFKLTQSSNSVALVESNDIPVDTLNTQLGGIVKIGKVIESLPLSAIYELDVLFSFEVLFNEFFQADLKKVEFGVSIYSCGAHDDDMSAAVRLHPQITQSIKKTLEENGVKAHFPQIKEPVISSASVDKNKLLRKGAEILIVVTQDEILVGKTQAIQEFEAFSKRDFGRPVRDMKSGVMPPKLARMMINIAGIPSKKTLLDPFCGSGTVLQEALHLGYQNIIGTDKSGKAIKDSRENIAWYQEKINPESKSALVRIQHGDVTKLSHNISHNTIDAIVTEPYLGPTLKKRLSASGVKTSIGTLAELYMYAWKEFYKVLVPGGVVVMILPVFQSGGSHTMPILRSIEKIGFTQIQLSGNQRKSITVGDNRDFVMREIVKFVKK